MPIVDLSSESKRATPDTSRGEKFDWLGRIEARLPASGEPCRCERDTKGRAAVECSQCGGSGFSVFRRPRNVEPVDAADEGVASYEVALALRDQGGMRTDRLGASAEELMAHPIADRTSSGSGRRRTAKAKSGEPQPKTARDGREELHPDTRARRGRPPTFVELGTSTPTARHVCIKMTISPETFAALLAEGMPIVELTEWGLSMNWSASHAA
jgi:hypothetical protein